MYLIIAVIALTVHDGNSIFIHQMSFSHCDWPLVHFYRPKRCIYLYGDHTIEQVDIKVKPLTFFHFSRPHKSHQFMIDPCMPLLQGKHMQCSWKLNGDRTPFRNENKVIQLQPSYRLRILSGPICVCSRLTFLFWLEMMCLHFATVTVLLNWQLRLLTGHRSLNKAVKMNAAFKHVWDVNREAQETQPDVRGG